MKKKIGIASITLLIIIGGVLFLNRQKLFPPKKVHFHAGFQVYVDGKLQDFSDVKYMDLQPCTQDNLNTDEQEAKAHLHEGVGDVVHVHRLGATWNDLFTNMHFSFDKTKPIEGYINGKKVDTVLSQQIKPYDSLVLFIGPHGPVQDYLPKAVTIAHIKKIESTSELCSS